MKYPCAPVLWLVALLVQGVQGDLHVPQEVSRIAFGSCNKEYRRQPLWEAIVSTKPDVFVWLGDAVYGDRRSEHIPMMRQPCSVEEMKAKYDMQSANPDYQHMLAHVPHVLGIWDDHDYGQNDGNHLYVDRAPAQVLFSDFLSDPPDAPRRHRAGVYQAHTFGPPGRRVTIMLLDVRYFKDEHEGSLLGEAQWRWFERTLQQHPDSQLYLIGSGVQIVSTDRPTFGEKWGAYPKDRSRLFSSLAAANLTGVVTLLSGDVHYAELSCIEAGLSHPVVEVTSSGMTHACGERGEFQFVPPLISYLCRFLLYVLPCRYQLDSMDYQHSINAVHGPNYYTMLNFGSVAIDWVEGTVVLGVHNASGAEVLRHSFSFNKSAFHSEHISCAKMSPFHEWTGPHISRMIMLAFLAVASLDFWLIAYLVYRFACYCRHRKDASAEKSKVA